MHWEHVFFQRHIASTLKGCFCTTTEDREAVLPLQPYRVEEEEDKEGGVLGILKGRGHCMLPYIKLGSGSSLSTWGG